MLSIIIPTLNEEKYLPLLLKSIKEQKLKPEDYEIIVADAGSKDKTVEIAKNNSCRVIKGGLPAKGRNEGVKAAKGDLILFLDADVILPPIFLDSAIKEFYRKKIDIATFPILIEGDEVNKFISKFYNSWTKMTKDFLPHAFGATILVKKELHQALNGFDEEIKLAEDHAYARKAKKIANFDYLKTEPVLTSSRRFKQDGRIRTCLKFVLAEFYINSLGPIKSDIFSYKLGHYPKDKR